MICKYILLIRFLTELVLILYAIKWFQVFLCITDNSIKHLSFVYSQLNNQTVLFLTIPISHSQNLQNWSLIIRLFYVLSRTLVVGEGLTPLQRCSWCILQPHLIGLEFIITAPQNNTVKRNWLKKIEYT